MKSPQWKTYRTRFLVKAKQLDSKLSFTDHLGREHRGAKGDYLVESFDGVLTITPRNIFEDVYVPMLLADAHPSDSSARPNGASAMIAGSMEARMERSLEPRAAQKTGQKKTGQKIESRIAAQLAAWKMKTKPPAIASLQIEEIRSSRFPETPASLSPTDPDPSSVRRKSPQPVRSASRRIGLM
jgi:hypothetical protein